MVFQRRSALNSVVLGKILVLLMMLPLSSVQAFEYDWSGFATIGMGKQDGSNILFQEFDENLSMSTDTKIGGQLDIKFNEQWSFSTQAAIQAYTFTPDKDYKPTLSSAYFRYQPNAANLIRFGLMRTPHYYFSEYTEVGAAYPWVRLPTTVYEKSFDPLDDQYKLDFIHFAEYKDWFISSRLSLGHPLGGPNIDGKYDFDTSLGLSVVAERDDLILRLGTYLSKLDVYSYNDDLNDLIAGLYGFGAIPGLEEFNTLADELSFKDVQIAYTSFSLVWEPGQWAIYAEIYNLDNQSKFFANSLGSYISFLYQFDRFAPYIVIGSTKTEGDKQEILDLIANASPTIALPPQQLAIIEGLRAGTTEVQKVYESAYDNLAIGMRYDLSSTMVFKAQVDGFYARRDSLKRDFAYAGDPSQGRNTYLYSISLDMVF